jgi:RNase P subunit RPR2
MGERPRKMPDKVWRQMLYNQGKVDQQAALQWLNDHWGTDKRSCPICTHIEWGVGDELVRLRDERMKATYPCVAVICQYCGYTMLFNASVMQLLPLGKG